MLKHTILIGLTDQEGSILDYFTLDADHYHEVANIKSILNTRPEEDSEPDPNSPDREIGVCKRQNKASLVWVYADGRTKRLGFYMDVPDELRLYMRRIEDIKPDEQSERIVVWRHLEKLFTALNNPYEAKAKEASSAFKLVETRIRDMLSSINRELCDGETNMSVTYAFPLDYGITDSLWIRKGTIRIIGGDLSTG